MIILTFSYCLLITNPWKAIDSFISFKLECVPTIHFYYLPKIIHKREITHFYLLVSTKFSMENVDEIT